MKKILGFLSLAVVLAGFAVLSSCNSMSSGSNFEGVINYEFQTNASLPPEAAGMIKTMEIKTFIKGTLSRREEKMAENGSITIGDSKTPDDPTVLMNMMGKKYAVKLNDSLKKIEAANVPKIEYIDSANSTKQIAGYACKKAKVTINVPNSGPVTSYVYYTTDLPYADPTGQFKGLKGMPMEYTVSMMNISLTISAKSVEKKTLSDSLFVIPSDYKKMSIEEMEKDLMKSMGGAAGADSASASAPDTTKK